MLFVDDEESILFAVRDYFAGAGYEVIDTARDIHEAEARLAERTYQVVVIDLRLDHTDPPIGFQLASRVRRQYPSTATVLFTAHGTARIERAAARLGVTYLEKPLPLPALPAVIEGLQPPNPPNHPSRRQP